MDRTTPALRQTFASHRALAAAGFTCVVQRRPSACGARVQHAVHKHCDLCAQHAHAHAHAHTHSTSISQPCLHRTHLRKPAVRERHMRPRPERQTRSADAECRVHGAPRVYHDSVMPPHHIRLLSLVAHAATTHVWPCMLTNGFMFTFQPSDLANIGLLRPTKSMLIQN